MGSAARSFVPIRREIPHNKTLGPYTNDVTPKGAITKKTHFLAIFGHFHGCFVHFFVVNCIRF